jgi:hypothetical protein
MRRRDPHLLRQILGLTAEYAAIASRPCARQAVASP